MKPGWSRRRRFVGAVIVGGAVLTLTDSRSDGAQEAAVPSAAQEERVAQRTHEGAPPRVHAALELPQRPGPRGDGDGVNLFAPHSWYVAPPPPPPQPAPQAQQPVAPPLPFTVIGTYAEEGGSTVYFLQQGDRVHDARAGDVIDGTYAVNGESGGMLMLTYLPLDQQQSLQVGPTP